MKLFETVTKHFAWYTDVLMSCIDEMAVRLHFKKGEGHIGVEAI